MTAMSDDELLRYNRHIMMPELDITGQQRLRDAHALVMGLGGLGSPVALYLACLLYTSPSPRDATLSRMPSSA